MVIPEYVVQQAADAVADDESNGFLKVLRAGEEFKMAGLTPVYVIDHRFKDLHVIAKEIHGKKLH